MNVPFEEVCDYTYQMLIKRLQHRHLIIRNVVVTLKSISCVYEARIAHNDIKSDSSLIHQL